MAYGGGEEGRRRGEQEDEVEEKEEEKEKHILRNLATPSEGVEKKESLSHRSESIGL